MKAVWFLTLFLFATSTAFAKELVIYIARHGETGTNKEHLFVGQKLHPLALLTVRGKEQAESLKNLLDEETIQKIYVSRLERTHQTAAPLANFLKITPFVRSQLDEINGGLYEEKILTSPEVLKSITDVRKNCSLPIGPGGETRDDHFRRVQEIWNEITELDKSERVLLISHFGTVRELLRVILNLNCSDSGEIDPKNDDVFRIHLKDKKISDIQWSRKRGKFESVTKEKLLSQMVPSYR